MNSVVTPTTRHSTAKAASDTPLHSAVPVLLTVPAMNVLRVAAPPVVSAQSVPLALTAPVKPAPLVSPRLSAPAGPVGASPATGSILPPGVFGPPVTETSTATAADSSATPVAQAVGATAAATSGTAAPTVLASMAPVPSTVVSTGPAPFKVTKAAPLQVMVFASPSTRSYFAALGVDYQESVAIWENFLRRHDIGFEVTSNYAGWDRSFNKVLVLPSSVALTDGEKRAIDSFRDRGGSVLSTWLTGVRSERGEWLGFGFMERSLNTKVVGNTEATVDDTFVMPHGDNPVLHRLPAGLRVWIERAPEWYALRLNGAHSAAEIMDWSRTVKAGNPSSVIAFDERVMASGKASRSVVLGYPERAWSVNERGAMETMAVDVLNWLARQPDVYATAWPWPFRSALVVAVDTADRLTESALRYAKLAEELGGGASYFVLTEHAARLTPILKDLQSRGHEIAYLGDQFLGFKDQSGDTQGLRLDAMAATMNSTGIDLGPAPGFRAPMESYDALTEELLSERGFSYLVGDPGSSQARLPVSLEGKSSVNKLVNLPRTQSGPDDALTRGDWATALSDFADEFTLTQQMAGLGVIRIPGQSALSEAQWAQVARHMKANSPIMWTATAGRVAAWWRERARVRVALDTAVAPPLLTVVVSGTEPLRQAVTLLVNLPQATSALSLVGDADETATPKVVAVDKWRHALILEGLAPGPHHWFLDFDRAHSAPK